jgi:phosphatidate cytidylyltransferase
MLLARVLTAIALLAVALPAMLASQWWAWPLFSLVICLVAAREWGRLQVLAGPALGKTDSQPARTPGVSAWILFALVLVNCLAYWWARSQGFTVGLQNAAWLWAAIGLAWLVVGPIRLSKLDARSAGLWVGAISLTACWVALFELHRLGIGWLLSSLAIVWVADIGAYFVGRTLGRRKLAQRISPGKSWEGALGGWLFVLILGLSSAAWPALSDTITAQAVMQWSPLGAVVLLSAVVAASIIGDLHESLLKRQAGVKDSGRSLPGHGGVLDRIDALIPSMPLALAAGLWLKAGQ